VPLAPRPCVALAGFALALVLAGCGDADPAEPSRTGAAVTADTAAPPTTAAREPAADQTAPVGTNGLAVDADGDLWVADLDGAQLLEVDPATGAILRRFGATDGVDAPDDVAVDAAGNVWWTGFLTGRVGRVSPDGTNVIMAELAPGANPIAVRADGRVVVALAFTGDALYELDPTGVDEPRLIVDAPGALNGFAFGDGGRLYAPRFGVGGTGSVVAVDVDSGAIETLAQGLSLNSSVKTGADGTPYVLTGAPSTVSTLDLATGELEPVASVPTAAVDNMAFAPDGTLYVSSFNTPTISVVAPGGTVTTFDVGDSSG
jgi:streptogramin lyase